MIYLQIKKYFELNYCQRNLINKLKAEGNVKRLRNTLIRYSVYYHMIFGTESSLMQ